MSQRKLSRKEFRKASRKLAKAKKIAFQTKKPLEEMALKVPGAYDALPQSLKTLGKKKKKPKSVDADERPLSSSRPNSGPVEVKMTARDLKEAEKAKRKLARQAIAAEEKEAKRMEKLLGLNKRKNKSKLPKSIAESGLDYLLDFCDSAKRKHLMEDEEGSDFDEQFDVEKPSTSKSKQTMDDGNSDDSDSAPDETTSKSFGNKQQSNAKPPSAKRVRFSETKEEKEFEKDSNPDDDEEEDDSDGSNDEEDSDVDGTEEIDDEEEEDETSVGLDDGEEAEDSGDDGEGEDDNGDGSMDDSDVDDIDNREEEKEDVYGRKVDGQGRLLEMQGKSETNRRRLLEELDAKRAADIDPEEKLKLQKQIKRIMNQVSESSLASSCKSLGDLYASSSRNDVKQTLVNCLLASIAVPYHLPPRMGLEYSAYITLLHSMVSAELSSFLVEQLVKKLCDLLLQQTNFDDDRSVRNVVTVIGHLYSFKVVTSKLVLEIMEHLLERFSEADIELLMVILTNVGFTVRKDDPNGLKNVIHSVQTKISSSESKQLKEQAKIRFMFDALMAIKNNNNLKLKNNTDYDPELLQHFIKLIRAIVKKGLESPLAPGFQDYLNAEEKGRWWVIGSAWIGNQAAATAPAGQAETGDRKRRRSGIDDALLDSDMLALAKKYRMNTPLRRSIFSAIMSSEDFIDGFQRLLKLNLKGQEEREIIHIAVQCCLKEIRFNAFYAHLINKFLQHQKRFLLTTQFAIWDRVKEFSSNSKPHHIANLASLTAKLILFGSLPLTVLKVIDFSQLESGQANYLRYLLSTVLMEPKDVGDLKVVFGKLLATKATKTSSDTLLEGLKLFLSHSMKKYAQRTWPKDADKDKRKRFDERLEFVLSLLLESLASLM